MSHSTVGELSTILDQGKFDKFFELIDQISQDDANSYTFKILKARGLRRIGKAEDALELIESINTNETRIRYKLNTEMLYCYHVLGDTNFDYIKDKLLNSYDYDDVDYAYLNYLLAVHTVNPFENMQDLLEYTRISEEIFNKLNDDYGLGLIYYLKARTYHILNQYGKALECIEKAIIHREKIGNVDEIANTLIMNSIIYYQTDISKSYDLLMEALKYKDQIYKKIIISKIFNSLGLHAMFKDGGDQARKYAKEGMEIALEGKGNKTEISDAVALYSMVLRRTGFNNKALEIGKDYLTKEFNENDPSYYEMGFIMGIAFDLFDTAFEEQEMETIAWLIDSLKSRYGGLINENPENPIAKSSKTAVEYFEILYLTFNGGFEAYLNAKKFLTSILSGKSSLYEFMKAPVKIRLIEIVFMELKISPSNQLINQVNEIIGSFKLEALDQLNPTVIYYKVLVSIYAAQLKLISGNYAEAILSFDEIKEIAKNQGLDILLKKVELILEEIELEYKSLKHLFDPGSTIGQRMKQMKLESYIEKAKKIVET